MKWCCHRFEGLVACAGEAGLSVIVVTIGDQDSFVLHARAVDVGTQIPPVPIKITTVTQQAIFSCPGCGVRLAKHYRKSMERLRREDLKVH
jgi:hypothetical protein